MTGTLGPDRWGLGKSSPESPIRLQPTGRFRRSGEEGNCGMRHDAKLGLSLGMLATGFAVAFCFPRQPERSVWPHAGTTSISDEKLGFLPIRAYQPPTPPASLARPFAPKEVTLVEGVPSTEVTLPAPLQSHVAGFPIAPIPTGPVPPAQTAEQTNLKPVEPTSGVTSSRPPEPSPATEVPQRYVVRPGDSLSTIAGRFLGSQGRFMEIFSANQDQLASPDRLQVGMELLIPQEARPPLKLAPAALAGSEVSALPAGNGPASTLIPSPYSQAAGEQSTTRSSMTR